MEVVQAVERPASPKLLKRLSPRKKLVIGAACLFLILLGTVGLAAAWPFTQKAVTETLENRFARQVVIQNFRKTYFPPGCIAEGVSFLHRKHKNMPPLIVVQKLVIRGSYSGMLPFNKHVSQVNVTGLHITVPPPAAGGAHQIMPLTDADKNIPINDINVDGAVLEFRSNQPSHPPFRLSINTLKLDNVGGVGQIGYAASIRNTQPPGDIYANGAFGPWNSDDPGATPLTGSFSYNGAKLDVFGGISGNLSSRGKFNGTLARLESDGTVDVIDFHVSGGSEAVHLSSQFHAAVDAVNGDTSLQNVRAQFLHTVVTSTGSVTGSGGGAGKDTILDLNVKDGRIDDFLRLFAGSQVPSMTGRISLHAKAAVPPGPTEFLRKLAMEGDFGLSGGKFTNSAVQLPINHVSDSARGENKKQELEDPTTALSNLKGHVSVQGGVAKLSNVSFTVPGGSARMLGTFNLLTKQVNIKGVLYTDGKLSDATSGFKALVLKAVTPFMKKKKTTIVPFTITGTSREPKFALDFDGSRKL